MSLTYDDLVPLMTADEVAAFLNVPRSAVYRIPDDELPRLTVGHRRTRFRREDVERFVAGAPVRPGDDPAVEALVDRLAERTVEVLRQLLDPDDLDRALGLMSEAWRPILEGTED